ncbi:RNA-binding protein [Synechococcales cyanobacterium C]|uniref:RNA-binding protein n=1 Tax=Petrachloros mirabilis ULC683 TaxID=2781853 RepID=A0A8K2A170_9CYAN|nr:RNA-binding protein [Petrachloros mirabilis]NCJ07547.1 RNA-binding protein [Petrachloros mirabilis ULC683]
MSVRLYVGNLPKELERQELENLFTQEVGESASTKVVTDRKTGKCRGFGFVTVATEEQADQVIEKLNGHVFKDSALKIEKALPKSKEATTQPSSSTASSAPRRKNKGRQATTASYGSSGADSSQQPDPRWADDLEKLKELLLAQTNA